jgi:hypothetical protein
MRILKLALISFIVLFALATVISLLLPSSITISRAIDIYSSKDTVYAQINNLEQWKYWIENRDSLPVSVNTTSHPTFVLGTTKAWITKSSKDQVATNWQVGKGQILPSEFNFIEQKGSTYITLQWKFVQKVKWYPWEKLASIVSDKILGQFIEASLDNLKRHVEQQVVKD